MMKSSKLEENYEFDEKKINCDKENKFLLKLFSVLYQNYFSSSKFVKSSRHTGKNQKLS